MPPIPQAPIKVAILDDYLNTADSHFSSLKPHFEVVSFPDTLPAYNNPSTSSSVRRELEDRLRPFPVISCMRERTPFPATLLKNLPNLKLLLSTGGRNRGIDMEAAKSLGITVTGTTGDGRSDSLTPKKKTPGEDSTTEHTVALILGIARNIALDDKVVKEGGWQSDLATGLSGKVFATLGLGRLGVNVAKIMYQSFGMKVIAWSSNLTQAIADEQAKNAGLPIEDEDGEKTFTVVSKEELFKHGDILSVHYALSQRSTGIVAKEDFALMKKGAFFINTSRGPIVVEEDLLDTLREGRIRGAALDVFDVEPLPADSPWRTTKWRENGSSHVLLSPHMGYGERQTINNWYAEQVEILEKWHHGLPLLNVLT
ncbi:hypothetical protein B7494_g5567 [Chlorociboria aeruginascens]|nr:hypothetical protein B7494_g5567 [Chlorociboria aeruginascens]